MRVNKYDEDEQNTSFKISNYKRALLYIKKYKFKLLLVFLLNCIAVISSLSITKIIQYVIDNIIPTNDFSKLWIIMFGTLALVLLTVFITKIYSKILAHINQNIVEDIKNDLFSHIQYLSSQYYDTRPHGKILVRLTEYAQDVSTIITDKLVSTIFDFFNMLIVLVFMFATSVKLTLIVIAGIVIISIIFALTAQLKRNYKLLINNKNSNFNAYLLETLRGMETTQAFHRAEKNEAIFNNLSDNWKEASCNSIKISNVGWCSVQSISHFVYASIYFVGAMFLYPAVSVGVIVAMGSYSTKFWSPIESLFSNFDKFINSFTYLERILETIDEPIDIQDSPNAIDTEITGGIEFKDVCFSYIENHRVLDNISFKIQPKEKVAIVGATGSGKTTITNLIGRFYDIDSGNIFIDNIDIRDIKLNCMRKQIAIMQQENYLFSTSIIKNLKYGVDNITDEEVINICKKLSVHDWILSFDDSYNTILSANGKNLSDGERQILCYIRTIINNPKILIFDEATSKMDVKTEKMLQNLTNELIKNKTVITIAHRLNSIINCDKIFFIKNKHVSEVGTHKELMDLKGAYFELFNSQGKVLK